MNSLAAMRRVPVAIMLCLVAPASVRAQEPQLLEGFSAATAQRLTSLFDSAAAEGLPTRALINRANEGLTKSAPEIKIVEVVARLRSDLQVARLALGISTTSDELTSAAAALRAGVSIDKLKQLRQLRGKQPVTVPLDAWLGLINRGALPDKAWDHIEGLAKRQARDAEFIRLTPADLLRGVPKGEP